MTAKRYAKRRRRLDWGIYRANAASPQRTQQLSDILAGPVYAAEWRHPGRLRRLANASEA